MEEKILYICDDEEIFERHVFYKFQIICGEILFAKSQTQFMKVELENVVSFRQSEAIEDEWFLTIKKGVRDAKKK